MKKLLIISLLIMSSYSNAVINNDPLPDLYPRTTLGADKNQNMVNDSIEKYVKSTKSSKEAQAAIIHYLEHFSKVANGEPAQARDLYISLMNAETCLKANNVKPEYFVNILNMLNEDKELLTRFENNKKLANPLPKRHELAGCNIRIKS